MIVAEVMTKASLDELRGKNKLSFVKEEMYFAKTMGKSMESVFCMYVFFLI
jgi:hypothetical protein